MSSATLPDLHFDAQGLIPAVVQEVTTGTVLMVAYMNRDALELTVSTGEVHFWSRQRRKIWHKGETSGATLLVRELQADCDSDVLLVGVIATGPACHLGHPSCFRDPVTTLGRLDAVLADRRLLRPPASHTTELLNGGPPLAARKVGEEAAETLVAALSESPERLQAEVADLWYHAAVLLLSRGLQLHDLLAELDRRLPPAGVVSPT